MGFWKRLFGRKKRQEEEVDEVVCERDSVDFNRPEERKQYITSCLEQMAEAEKEIRLLTGEYSLVTAYLTDIEEIEALPPEQTEEIKSIATKLTTLEQERKSYLGKPRMSDAEYGKIQSQENEIAEGKVCCCFDIVPVEYKNEHTECPYYVKV